MDIPRIPSGNFLLREFFAACEVQNYRHLVYRLKVVLAIVSNRCSPTNFGPKTLISVILPVLTDYLLCVYAVDMIVCEHLYLGDLLFTGMTVMIMLKGGASVFVVLLV